MGKLNCVGHGDKTQRGKERKRKRYAYYHQGHEICKGAFMLLHGVSKKYVKNIVAHMNENGNVPRVHKNKNKRPANAFSFDELKHALNYIMHYAEEVGLPQPMVRGKGNPVVFLPSSGSKSDLHKQYVASCEEAGIRHLGLTSFKLLWKDCCPHIKFMSPMSDMCPKCEEHRDAISKAVGMEQKQEAVRLFSEHLTIVQKEREVYNKSVDDARVEMTDYVRPAGVIPPCSATLTKVHYTMDFSQAVSVPHHARQEGPLYFLVPRKLQLFGIAVEGIFRQFNYVIDEDQTIGENGVISMLHHCLQQNGFGEEECIIHCDNCAGENKNRYVLGYLSWRTLIGLHKKITLSMQVPYHGRCLVDAGFGHIKRLYRRTDVDSLSSMINAVDKSAKSNVPVGYENPRNGEHNWEWYDWKTYLSTHFSPLPGIRKYRHFTFNVQSPGLYIEHIVKFFLFHTLL
ncbi:hypothetical protein FSP39_024721 [Pinctada imbricata]|uniref:DUF7869 domain-containing protein n=1 Tax=Pinctada imbricata TaxID=66713 RepID=A0AA88YPD3_PINIB|nr:hypothetical protein FSP39_024721 [Pinctada imbricata]